MSSASNDFESDLDFVWDDDESESTQEPQQLQATPIPVQLNPKFDETVISTQAAGAIAASMSLNQHENNTNIPSSETSSSDEVDVGICRRKGNARLWSPEDLTVLEQFVQSNAYNVLNIIRAFQSGDDTKLERMMKRHGYLGLRKKLVQLYGLKTMPKQLFTKNYAIVCDLVKNYADENNRITSNSIQLYRDIDYRIGMMDPDELRRCVSKFGCTMKTLKRKHCEKNMPIEDIRTVHDLLSFYSPTMQNKHETIEMRYAASDFYPLRQILTLEQVSSYQTLCTENNNAWPTDKATSALLSLYKHCQAENIILNRVNMIALVISKSPQFDDLKQANIDLLCCKFPTVIATIKLDQHEMEYARKKQKLTSESN